MTERRLPFPNTHWSLVRRAGSADDVARQEALAVLLERYRPALFSFLVSTRHMSPDVAEDLLQAFIANRIMERELIRKADEKVGRFRAFLMTSLSNFATTRFRYERVRATVPLPLAMEAQDNVPAPLQFEAAWARQLIHDVIETMREECARTNRQDVWMVFEGRLLGQFIHDKEPVNYEELAVTLKLSTPVQAANLLVTAKRMYARLMRLAIAEYEQTPEDIDQEIVELRQVLAKSPTSRDG